MDRRMFLKGTGAGLMHPGGLLALGPTLVRQGNRRLKDITPDGLMELLAWAKIDTEDVATVEDTQRERGRPITSLHPQYCFEYCEGNPDTGLQDRIWFRYWCSHTDEDPEWDEVDAMGRLMVPSGLVTRAPMTVTLLQFRSSWLSGSLTTVSRSGE
jgi:hypothetical protein